MIDLLHDPLWKADDLGKPIPESRHAVSVCLPTWKDNIGYEENEARVHDRLETGYPRFVYNRICRDLFAKCEQRFATDGEHCLAYPSRSTAERFAKFLSAETGCSVGIHSVGYENIHAVCFSNEFAEVARNGWQHFGEGVSSRLAEACLTQRTVTDQPEVRTALRERIANSANVSADDVYLFSCGMSAMTALHRALCSISPDRKSVQFAFPYVDTLKIQQKSGPGVHFFPRGNAEDLRRLEAVLESETISGIFTEFPSNPLLYSPNLNRLAELSRKHDCPLIVDDTVATTVNVDLTNIADAICSSLTKFFSGMGDVTGGSVILSRQSPFYNRLTSLFQNEEDDDDRLWLEDAVILEKNSRDFEQRVTAINTSARSLATFLNNHPKISRVYYPTFDTPELYAAFLKPGGGYGGLMSVLLHNAAENAPRFYDALRVCKGPSLGTNYSLACPYTILAHYRELDFAESCGVSRYLIRVSVGLEEPDDLIGRFDDALNQL